MTCPINYRSFSNGAARRILVDLIDFDPADAKNWNDYTMRMTRHLSGNDALWLCIKQCGLSSGERVLLAACLSAGDFSAQADELVPNFLSRAWWCGLDDAHSLGVAATFARIN